MADADDNSHCTCTRNESVTVLSAWRVLAQDVPYLPPHTDEDTDPRELAQDHTAGNWYSLVPEPVCVSALSPGQGPFFSLTGIEHYASILPRYSRMQLEKRRPPRL